MKILVMELSGSGKTTFCNRIKTVFPTAIHLNACKVRTFYNDWNFSL